MTMRTSVIATMAYGLACAVLYLPLAAVFGELVPGWMAWQFHMLFYLAGFGLILWRLSGARLVSVAMPWIFVFCVAGVGLRTTGFFLLCLAALAWIRSGICYTRPWYRTIPAEFAVVLLSAMFFIWFVLSNGLAMDMCV